MRHRRWWAALAGVAMAAAFATALPAAHAQTPSATEHPVPTTPPGADATRPPGPWVDPQPAPTGCSPEAEPNDQAPDAGVRVLPTEFCVSGTLEALRDQDLYFWEVPAADGLTTWDVSVRGVPTTYTSVHVFDLDSAVGVVPLDLGAGEVARVDSDVWVGTPVRTTGLRLAPGPYLLGISRADPGYNQTITDDMSYWVRLRRNEGALPPSGDAEPNDEPGSAVPIEGAVSFAGDAGVTRDVYRWQIPQGGPDQPWRVVVEGAPTSNINVWVTDADGTILMRDYVDATGVAAIEDIGLDTGLAFIWVEGRATVDPYTLTTERSPASADPEPNDDRDHALVLDPASRTATGRLTTDDPVDRYWADIDQALAGQLVDISLAWSGDERRQLCLGDEQGSTIACAEGPDSVDLRGLLLAPGRYLLSVDGDGDADDVYTLAVASAGTAQPPREVEPNDDVAMAQPLAGAFEVSGDLVGGRDVFAWSVTEADAGRQWHLDLSATSGLRAYLTLLGPDGQQLATTTTGGAGDARIWDLRLAPGTWTLQLEAGSSEAPAYVLRAVPSTDTDADAEPNDRTPLAMDQTTLLARGRIATQGERDLYTFQLPEAMAATLTDIELAWPGGGTRQLCLRTGDGSFVQCNDGPGGVTLSSLDLAAGPYALEVIGDAAPASRYELRVLAGAARSPDAESEPNDDDRTADGWDPALTMHATARDGDVDVYRVQVPLGVPHRWQVRVLGTGLKAPAWRQPDGALAGTASVSDDGTQAVIEDLVLVSGDHLLTVTGDGGYVLAMTDLGELDPSAESEPNDTAEFAGRLPWDALRHGRLAAASDVDVYRFSLTAPEHVVITAAPDGEAGGGLALDGIALGEPDRDADPRGLVDVEVVSVTTPLARARGTADGSPTVLDAVLPPGDHEVRLRTGARGGSGYTLRLQRADPFLVPGAALPPALPASLSLDSSTDRVAAYVAQGQRVPATLAIANGSAEPFDLRLQAVTSDLRWTVFLPEAVSVAAGATVEVPIEVNVPPDASRDIPVRISVAGRTRQGAQSSVSLDITPVQDVAPVAPTAAWPLPPELLGGLDVASLRSGAVPATSSGEGLLPHDGYAVAGAGLRGWLQNEPLELEVDLAGDDLVPVVGTVLDATALDGILGQRPRAFELWLSADGTTWDLALAAEATTLTTEQAFVLPAPVDARHARLRLLSNWGDTSGTVALGEWKVVAAPGWASGGPVDIGAGRNGGHVVWTAPDLSDPDMAALLDATDTDVQDNVRYRPGETQDVVVGFRDDRAAQVEQLEWQEQPGTDPASRFVRAQVGVSTGSPLGPWRALGPWDLAVRPDGTVAPFELPDGTWARFVRLTLEGPPEGDAYRAIPGELRIIERATDDDYRSILGEWGHGSPRGPFETLVPEAEAPGTPDDPDAPDDAAEALAVSEGERVTGQVARAADVDWYQVTVPDGQNELTLRLATERPTDVRMTILDEAGQPAAFRVASDPDTGERVWTAYVRPGETYRVGLEQPVLSVVIAFDSSGSVAPWWPLIRAAVRTFVDDITPGQEAAIVLPYQEPPLPQDWSDQAWLIRAALDARSTSSGSSCLSCAMDDATASLGERDGARAMLVLGDAVGGGLVGGLDEEALAETGTSVFTVHFGAPGDEATSTQVMQDLARANGGSYQYATSTGEVDRAFDRMATWLRRPADYAFGWDADVVPPGVISVVTAEGADIRIGGVAVELILDTSGSMDADLGRRKRIDVAKRSLSRLVEESLPEGLPVALRTFKAGTRDKPSCATSLAVKLGPLDKAAMLRRIDRIKIGQGTRTPLAKAIEAAGADIGGVDGPRIVVLVTDGAETCKGDPEAAVRGLVAAGIDTTVNIVGFALDDEDLKAQMAAWAEAGGGSFFDAQDQAGLSTGMAAALRAPFRVYDAEGVQVADGIVGDAAVSVEPGRYRVEVLSEPPIVFEDVQVDPAAGVQLTVGGEGG